MRCSLAVIAASLISLPARSRAGDPDPPAGAAQVSPADPAEASPDAAPPADAAQAPIVITERLAIEEAARGQHLMAEITIGGSARGVAEEFLVLPDGAEVGGRLRTIMADDALGTGAIHLTDVALLDVHAQWAFAHHFELDGAISLLPKQPSSTDEPVFQGGSLAVRRDLVTRTAIAVSGSASPLLGRKGVAFGGGVAVMHKHRLNEIVTFALTGGATTTWIRDRGPAPAEAARGSDTPFLVEGGGHAAVLVRADRFWGGWLGAGYALPAVSRGRDPMSGMPLDPQPRLDLNVGSAVWLGDQWDLSAELSIIDRGELDNPATRLPLLDGGFDQIQLTIGISRRLASKDSQQRRGVGEPMQIW